MAFRLLDGNGLSYAVSVLSQKISEKFNALAKVARSGNYIDLTNKPTIPKVINNLSSTSTTDALSAGQGRYLNNRVITVIDKMGVYTDFRNGSYLIPSKTSYRATFVLPPEPGFYLVVINVTFDISTNAITVLNVNCDDGQGQYTVRSTMSGGGGMTVTRILDNSSGTKAVDIWIYQGHTESVTANIKYEFIRLPVLS